jgi:cytochrome c biogenesis protein CcmG/thiol:disulfide interchange protein DsbE
MRRVLLPALAILAAASFAALIIFGVSQTANDRSIDQAVAAGRVPTAPAAKTKLPMLDGVGSTSLASLRGKVVVLNLWASWCPPCREEAPDLAALQKRIVPLGGTVLGVAWNDTIPDAKAFVAKEKLNYLQARDVDGSFAKAYGTKGLPETFVITRDGRISSFRRGAIDNRFLDAALVPLLGSKAASK